jgi:hypothetical protein
MKPPPPGKNGARPLGLVPGATGTNGMPTGICRNMAPGGPMGRTMTGPCWPGLKPTIWPGAPMKPPGAIMTGMGVGIMPPDMGML